MKPLLCALALLALSAPLHAQTEAAPTEAPATQTQDAPKAATLDNGLVVTPVILPYDDLSSLLDVQMWRFNIKPQKPDIFLEARLEWRKTGEDALPMGGIGFVLGNETELTFGTTPKGGSGFNDADFWRVHYAARRPSGEFDSPPFDIGVSNPTRGIVWQKDAVSGQYGAIARPSPNGDVPLQKFTAGTPENPTVAELVLVLTAKPQPK